MNAAAVMAATIATNHGFVIAHEPHLTNRLARHRCARQGYGLHQHRNFGIPRPFSRGCSPRASTDLSKVQSVDQRMRNAVSAFANCGRAVAHVPGSYVPRPEVTH